MADEQLIKVFDIKRSIEREVTRQAYMAKGPKVYRKIGEVDAPAATSPNFNPQTQRLSASVRVVPPVVNESVEENETEQVESTIENNEVVGETLNAPEKKKSGRKPKSISSPSVEAGK
jgi:hypothetical protein